LIFLLHIFKSIAVKRKNITKQSAGVITSPGYPTKMHMAHNEWIFIPTMPNAKLLLEFEEARFYRFNG